MAYIKYQFPFGTRPIFRCVCYVRFRECVCRTQNPYEIAYQIFILPELVMVGYSRFTPLKINMEPKSEGLEDDFPFQTGDFLVPC